MAYDSTLDNFSFNKGCRPHFVWKLRLRLVGSKHTDLRPEKNDLGHNWSLKGLISGLGGHIWGLKDLIWDLGGLIWVLGD